MLFEAGADSASKLNDTFLAPPLDVIAQRSMASTRPGVARHVTVSRADAPASRRRGSPSTLLRSMSAKNYYSGGAPTGGYAPPQGPPPQMGMGGGYQQQPMSQGYYVCGVI